ncbi:fe-S oxidoreductase [Clostridium sp. CAG:609]|nr:fe-S oxidoreductase [Clostridium sp. CAG:609]
MFKNTLDNKRYHTLNYFFKKKFGQKVFKVPLDINSTCPNQYNGGCIYCSNKSVAGISDNTLDILEQFEKGRKIMEQKWPDSLYIPYFQSGTNTYNDKNLVKGYIDKLLLLPKVIGIDIATRPDCLSDEWLDYLEELNKKTFLIVELGLQSSNNNTLKFINRGHDKEIFKKAVEKLHERNIFVVAHIINGLPYEEKEDMINTIKFVNDLKIDGIKIHMLYIAKNTPLASYYENNKFHILTREEYIDIVCDQLRLLNPDVVVMRITGDPELNELVAPEWLIKKFMVLNGIDQEMAKRNIYQGDLL